MAQPALASPGMIEPRSSVYVIELRGLPAGIRPTFLHTFLRQSQPVPIELGYSATPGPRYFLGYPDPASAFLAFGTLNNARFLDTNHQVSLAPLGRFSSPMTEHTIFPTFSVAIQNGVLQQRASHTVFSMGEMSAAVMKRGGSVEQILKVVEMELYQGVRPGAVFRAVLEDGGTVTQLMQVIMFEKNHMLLAFC